MFLVAYRRDDGRLGDCAVPTLDPIRRALASGKRVRLPNGLSIDPRQVVSVARSAGDRMVAAWLVSQHGLDGTREERPPDPVSDWRTAWQELAACTAGLTREDPRRPAVLAALARAEAAYVAGDPHGFRAVIAGIARLQDGSRY